MTEDEQLIEWEQVEAEWDAAYVARYDLWLCDDGAP